MSQKTDLEEPLHDFDDLIKDDSRLQQLPDIEERVAINERHHNAVAIAVDRFRGGEPLLVQRLHESELTDRCEAGEVEPVEADTVLQVVAVAFDRLERSAPQPGQLDNRNTAVGGGAFIDIRLLSDADLAVDLGDDPAFHERLLMRREELRRSRACRSPDI